MAGTNPYIEKAEFELPLQNYDVTFLPMQKKVAVLSEKITTKSDGLPGSILNARTNNLSFLSKGFSTANLQNFVFVFVYLSLDFIKASNSGFAQSRIPNALPKTTPSGSIR